MGCVQPGSSFVALVRSHGHGHAGALRGTIDGADADVLGPGHECRADAPSHVVGMDPRLGPRVHVRRPVPELSERDQISGVIDDECTVALRHEVVFALVRHVAVDGHPVLAEDRPLVCVDDVHGRGVVVGNAEVAMYARGEELGPGHGGKPYS